MLYSYGYQFQPVLWMKNIEEKRKEMFQFVCYLKKPFGSNQQYIFMCFSLLHHPCPTRSSTLLSHFKKDGYDYFIQYKTLQVVLNNLFHFMNLLQFSSHISQKKRNGSTSFTQSLSDLNFSESNKNTGLIPTLAYMGRVLSCLK